MGFVDTEIDVRAQGVQRHTAFAVELGTAHLSTAEAAGALHPDALGTSALGALDRLAHRTAEGHTTGELFGNALGDELRVDLGVLHLKDVELNLLAGELLELTADAIGFGSATSDDDARTCGVDVDADTVTRAFDVDLGDAGPLEAGAHHPADLDIFEHIVLVALPRLRRVSEPLRLVIRGDSESESVRIDLLAH